MEVTLQQLAQIIGGNVYGNVNDKVSNIATIDKAGKGDLTFIANKKYLKYLKNTEATAVIIEEHVKDAKVNQIEVENPYLAYAKILTFFTSSKPNFSGISEKAHVEQSVKFIKKESVSVYPFVYIGENTEIDENVILFPNVFIGKNVKIGSNVTVHSGVSIYDNSVIGNNVVIHSGSVIGSDGYGYAKDGDEYFKIPQVGNVVIEDNVEIGANVTIDRGAINSTVIRKGVKIDNLVHIAHNVEIGEHSAIVAQVGISGSSKIGKRVILAGQVGVAGHLKIGDGVKVGAQSGIGKDVKNDEIISGSPAVEHSKWLKWAVSYYKLPELLRRVKKLEKKIGEK